ncbi:MAG TPA: 3-phosphoshikimate 1-carboxyvinyltransferase [Acidobacteriota bacterium]|nr:3-phosphoshikimate 1-carboxyvinyltransferase [Acidobacteriota bacterium]
MRRRILPAKKIGGRLQVPGDKSIAHRAAMLSLLSAGPITVRNFPDGADCRTSLRAVEKFGVRVECKDGDLVLEPPARLSIEPETIIDCGNSGTTARLLAGIVAGTDLTVILSGDESLSARPMKRIVDPLTAMGADMVDSEGHLPLKIRGSRLLPFEYHMPVASAQVKSALLLAGLASGCSVTVRESVITRNHTEIMLREIGRGVSVREIRPVLEEDPRDPRRRRTSMPEDFKREIAVSAEACVDGGHVDIPGDVSTAAFLFAAAAISGGTVTVENVGLNPTRTAFLTYLKTTGCRVETEERTVVSGEARGTVTVTGGELGARKISGETTVGLIDEIPIVAVMAARARGTTVVRDAAELRFKESDRLAAVAENLAAMGVKCGLLGDGLVIEGSDELSGADLKSFGDHRITMAFSIAALFGVGPSTIDDDSPVSISCPGFYNLVDSIVQ